MVGPEGRHTIVVVQPQRLPRGGELAEPAVGQGGGPAGEQQRPVGGAGQPRTVRTVPVQDVEGLGVPAEPVQVFGEGVGRPQDAALRPFG